MLLNQIIEHAERCHARRPAIVDGTERMSYAALVARARRAASGLRQLGLARGQHIAGVEMRIANEQATVVPPGTVGRIQVRGETVMSGYWRREVETAEAFVDGWLDTGDLGRMDEDGFLVIVDRAKDMIITGGENVYSTEVERALYSHPGVAHAAAIGLPDPRWGEAVTAVVVLRAGSSLGEPELIAHCRARLARFKCPKAVHFVTGMPRSGAGKILKPALREQFGAPGPRVDAP